MITFFCYFSRFFQTIKKNKKRQTLKNNHQKALITSNLLVKANLLPETVFILFTKYKTNVI